MSDFLQSEYYKKLFKFDNYHIVEKNFPKKWKMFIYAGDTCVRGKLPVLKSKEKEIMNDLFKHMLRYQRTMGMSIFVDYFETQFYCLSYDEIIEEYKKLLKEYK